MNEIKILNFPIHSGVLSGNLAHIAHLQDPFSSTCYFAEFGSFPLLSHINIHHFSSNIYTKHGFYLYTCYNYFQSNPYIDNKIYEQF